MPKIDLEFLNIIDHWINIEKNTIRVTKELLEKSQGKLINTMIGCIRDDSKKHQELLELIKKEINGESVVDDFEKESLTRFITAHTKVEENAVEIAEDALKKSKNPVINLILEYILQDEKKHDLLMFELAKLDLSEKPKY